VRLERVNKWSISMTDGGAGGDADDDYYDDENLL
jgi:hypothetical protein